MGRIRLSKWAPRIIDIDILGYHGITVNTKELTLPHPGTFNRPFVTPLLLEIAPHMAEKLNNRINLTLSMFYVTVVSIKIF